MTNRYADRGRAGDADDRALDSAEAADDGGFPLVVAALSTVAALILFFSTTIPALNEQRLLRKVEANHRQEHATLWQTLEDEALHRVALEIDVQSIMIELDRRGVDTRALLEEPSDGRGPGAVDDSDEARTRRAKIPQPEGSPPLPTRTRGRVRPPRAGRDAAQRQEFEGRGEIPR